MNTQPARGMRDFLPADVRRREHVIAAIKSVYERYGFEPLETPAVENLETLTGKYGEEGNQLIFKILKRGEHERSGEADLALRYDLTVPLARVVAEYRATLPRFFRRYQIQPVWRADRPARGRFREFYQCDVDVLGSRSMSVETELCAAASDALRALRFQDFAIRLNHRQALTAILDSCGIPAPRHGDALVALDKLDKIGRDGVQAELIKRGIETSAATRVLAFFGEVQALESTGDPASASKLVLERLAALIGSHEQGAIAIRELREILSLARGTSAGAHLAIDPSLARGLSYYTGAIFEIKVRDLAGSLGGGGRYDQLVGMFLGQDVPACGFSLGLERIIVVMGERGMFPESIALHHADVMVTVWNETALAESIVLAQEIRAAHLRADLYPEPDKLGKQLKYAASRNVPFVVVVGDDERARGAVTLKDLRSGEQRTLPRTELIAVLQQALKS